MASPAPAERETQYHMEPNMLGQSLLHTTVQYAGTKTERQSISVVERRTGILQAATWPHWCSACSESELCG